MIKYYYEEIQKKELSFDISNGYQIKTENKKYIVTNEIYQDFLLINNLSYNNIHYNYNNLIKELKISKDENIDWHKILGHKNFNIFIEKEKSNLDVLAKKINSYYFKILNLRKLLTSEFSSFLGKEKSNYNHVSSSTGRTVIKSGYNILTVRKSDRLNLRPQKDNHLIEIDVKSCEPNLLWYILYGEYNNDIYAIFENGIDRNKIKLAIISSLYGSSLEKTKKLSGLKTKDIEKIKSIFKMKELISHLKSKKELTNLYGRHLYTNSSYINYFLQSSAADYCHLAFLNLKRNLNLNLKCIIHDAIIVECNKKQKEEIMDIKYIVDPITQIKLPVDKKIIA